MSHDGVPGSGEAAFRNRDGSCGFAVCGGFLDDITRCYCFFSYREVLSVSSDD